MEIIIEVFAVRPFPLLRAICEVLNEKNTDGDFSFSIGEHGVPIILGKCDFANLILPEEIGKKETCECGEHNLIRTSEGTVILYLQDE